MGTQSHNQSLAGAAATALFLETFRLNGLLVAAGDRLTADIGLTSARWQVIGAIALAGRPLTVSQIARNMGRARQSVQRVANELQAAGLVAFAINPDHRRAKLVRLTDRGAAAYRAAMARQVPWVNGLAQGLEPEAINAALRIARALRERLEAADRELNS
ncbi:MAG: MarR family transcriptional regulator [Alphaproteobacteria bacterium]|nr:MarR family transcriptional regulator [Alphaproteobacteria bacterium]